MDLSRDIPYSLDLERSVLGALIQYENVYHTVSDMLKEDSFFKNENRLIFKAIVELQKESKASDLVNVAEQLKRNKDMKDAGGPVYLTKLTNLASTPSSIEEKAFNLLGYQMKRETITLGLAVVYLTLFKRAVK